MINYDIKKILDDRRIDYIDKGDWIHLKCLFPDHDDSNPSMSINIKHQGYNCFVCGAGKLSEMFEILGWNEEGFDNISVEPKRGIWEDTIKKIREKDEPEKVFKLPFGFQFIKEGVCLSYLEERKIDDVAGIFKIGWTGEDDNIYKKNYLNRIIIPVHNNKGKYIWPEGRSVLAGYKPKYYRPAGVHKNDYLFNIHRVKRMTTNFVVLVEGIIDAITLHKWGYPAVCTFGANLSERQLEQLVEFTKIFICFDIDKAGIKAFVEAKELLKGLGMSIYRVKLPRGKDANSVTYSVYDRYFRNAVKVF